MKTLSKIEEELIINQEKLDRTMPGSFVEYNSIKKKSSDIYLASSKGIIRKKKKRSPHKTLYEYLSLKIWHEVLNQYSSRNELNLKSPAPVGIGELNQDQNSLFMEFLNGYELQKLSKLKRTTPVTLESQETPLPLYPACALHLGFLDAVKEREGLVHSDYDSRHIIFAPSTKVYLGVVDLENSFLGNNQRVKEEGEKMIEHFMSKIISQKDRSALKSWYEQGHSGLISPPETPLVPKIIKNLEEELDIHLDFENKVINGYEISYSKNS